MVKEPTLRTKKWDKKIVPEIVKDRFEKVKDIGLEQFENWHNQIAEIEEKVKRYLEQKGLSVIEIPMYLSYARELAGKVLTSFSNETLRNEELAIRSKWVNRGLDNNTLMDIAKMLGIEPKELTIGVFKPELKGLSILGVFYG